MLAKFEAYFDGEYWCARGIGADVFTQGATLDELMNNIREAAELHFEDVFRVACSVTQYATRNTFHGFSGLLDRADVRFAVESGEAYLEI